MYNFYYKSPLTGEVIFFGAVDTAKEAVEMATHLVKGVRSEAIDNFRIVIDTPSAICSYPLLDWLGLA